MKPFKYISRGNTKNAWLFFGVMMSLAAVAFAVMQLKIGIPLLSQSIFLLAIIASVYILVRFVTAAYIYDVLWEEDGAFFCVTRLQGKKMIMQCKLPIAALAVITAVDRTEKKRPALNYSPVLFAEDDTYLFFATEEEKVTLRINANQAFLSALKNVAPDAADAFAQDASAPREDKVPTKKHGLYDFSDIPQEENTAPIKSMYDLSDLAPEEKSTEQSSDETEQK